MKKKRENVREGGPGEEKRGDAWIVKGEREDER